MSARGVFRHGEVCVRDGRHVRPARLRFPFVGPETLIKWHVGCVLTAYVYGVEGSEQLNSNQYQIGEKYGHAMDSSGLTLIESTIFTLAESKRRQR